jgi:hypothetical protein
VSCLHWGLLAPKGLSPRQCLFASTRSRSWMCLLKNCAQAIHRHVSIKLSRSQT